MKLCNYYDNVKLRAKLVRDQRTRLTPLVTDQLGTHQCKYQFNVVVLLTKPHIGGSHEASYWYRRHLF